MEDFNNIQTFIDNNCNYEYKIPKSLQKLLLFTFYNKVDKIISSRLPYFNILRAHNSWADYEFNYNGRLYPFSVFSDKNLQKFDKKTLKSGNRVKLSILRTLKLACSLDLLNPRITIGNSLLGTYSLLIIFQENGIDKVIDYASNLIMSKNDYYEIFKFNELNVIDKMDLYNIYYLMNKLNDYDHIFEYLLFTKEIINDLSKKDMFSFLREKYDRNGINSNNYLLFGNDSDCLFFQKEDTYHTKFTQIIKELEDFTENPQRKCKHISYDEKKKRYIFKAIQFGNFTFDLLSDFIEDEEIKKILLSTDRYGECHINSNILARSLSDTDKESAYIVGGKFKVNENDYFYHTWVEIDDKNIVLDFNLNIVMDRDKYYKLYEIVPISKTLATEMEDIIEIVNDARFNMHPMELNYFGSEIMRDLKKNEKIFRKQV